MLADEGAEPHMQTVTVMVSDHCYAGFVHGSVDT